MQYYIIVFDRRINQAYAEFHKRLVAHPNFSKWWHYIKSAYIVGTDLSAKDLSAFVTTTLKNCNLPTTHLVLVVDLTQRQGMLTEDAWKWIRENAVNQTATKPSQ
jgi:hypothetical protein